MAEVNPVTHTEKVIAKAGGDSTYSGVNAVTHLEHIIEKYGGGGGSSTDYATDINFSIDSSTFVITAQLKNKDGDPLGTAKTVDIPLESTVIGGSYNAQTKSLILTLVSGQSITIPIGDIISGLQAQLVVGVNLDDTPVQGSTNPITSGGVYAVVGNINTVLEEVL